MSHKLEDCELDHSGTCIFCGRRQVKTEANTSLPNTTQPDQPVDEHPISWQDVLEYYLGDYVWEHTPEECRQEAFRRTNEEAKENEARLQAECNRARLDERKKSQAFLHGLTITPENRHLFDVLSRDNYECIQQLMKGQS